MSPKNKRRRSRQGSYLTPARRAFALAYLSNGYNGTAAYAAAFPRANRHTAETQSWRVLRHPLVAAFIEKEKADRFLRLQMDGDEALALLSINARADIGRLYHPETGELLPIAEWPTEIRLCVKSIKSTEDGDTIVLHDALRARELMAIAAGRLKQTVEHKHKVSLARLLSDEPLEDTE